MRLAAFRFLVLALFVFSFTGLRSGSGSAPAVAQQVGLTIPNLVAYWPLDETTGTTAVDQAGNFDGTHMGNTLPTISTAVSPVPVGNQRSVLFNAAITNQRINVADNFALDFTGPFTLSCWAMISAATMNQMGLIEHWSGANPTISGYFIRFGRNGTTGNHYPMFSIGNGAAAQLYAESSGTAVPIGSWVHMAGVFDGTSIILYYNGSLTVTTATGGTNPTAGLADLHLGVDYGANRLNGNLDEARIYNRALSAGEVDTLRLGQAPPTALVLTPAPVSMNLSWTAPAPVTGVTVTYTVQRSTSATGPWTTVASGLTTTNYTDVGLIAGTTYYYRVFAVSVMESTPLTGNAIPLTGIPRPPSDNDEGLWGDKCACGSSISPAPQVLFGVAGLAALLLLAFRRR